MGYPCQSPGKKLIEKICLSPESTLKEAMERIDQVGSRCVFIVEEDWTLRGIITDGDVRRAMLKSTPLDTPVSAVMNAQPVTTKIDTPSAALLELMEHKGYLQVPVVDHEGRLTDLVLYSDLKRVPLSAPDVTQHEVDVINSVLSTPYLSIGPKVKEFEEKVATYVGIKHAVAVNSGTSALHLCIRALDIKDGDEVITTPFSFIASANCILFERAKPVFVDIDELTLGIDPSQIEEKITPRTKAILPVHIFGYPCAMDKILAIARQYNLAVIEDSCEALGTIYLGKQAGSFGNAGVFGFYPNKQITTGEGGMVVTNDDQIASMCRSMRNQGRDEESEWLSHVRLGYNYRMGELNAALGAAQIERIEEIVAQRQRVTEFYHERLSQLEGIQFMKPRSNMRVSWFVYVVRLDEQHFTTEDRDRIVRELNARGIGCRIYFPAIHLQPLYARMFGYKKGSFPVTEKVADLSFALPFYPNLKEQDVDYICDTLEQIIKRIPSYVF